MIILTKDIETLSKNLSSYDDVQGRSLWQDARIRFFKYKAAVTSLVLLLAILFFSFFGPFIAQWRNE